MNLNKYFCSIVDQTPIHFLGHLVHNNWNASVSLYFSRSSIVFNHCLALVLPCDSQGITKYHSDQYVRVVGSNGELFDVLCPSEAYEKVFWMLKFQVLKLPYH